MLTRIQSLPREKFIAVGDRLVASCQRLAGGLLVNNRPDFETRHPRKARVLRSYFREAVRRGRMTQNKKVA